MYNRVTPIHEGWRYKWHESSGPDVSGVVAAKVVCALLVPYPHFLRRAFFAVRSAAAAGAANTAKLFRSDSGAAKAQIATTLTIAAATNPATQDFVPTSAEEEAEQVGPTVYFVEIDNDNAGDSQTGPMLTLAVSPIPPGPA